MVIVFYIKHGVERDQPQVKIGKKTPQFTCTFLETYTQFNTWTELQGGKGSLASKGIERVRTGIGVEYLPQHQNYQISLKQTSVDIIIKFSWFWYGREGMEIKLSMKLKNGIHIDCDDNDPLKVTAGRNACRPNLPSD